MVLMRRGRLAGDLHSLQERMNRLLEEGFSGAGGQRQSPAQWQPAVDIYEKKDSFVLEVDLPGVSLQDVEVEVKDNALHIKGSVLSEERDPSDLFLRQERPSGVFHRVFSLPVDAEHEKVRAKLKNGVLKVIVPKKEAAKPKQITVDAP